MATHGVHNPYHTNCGIPLLTSKYLDSKLILIASLPPLVCIYIHTHMYIYIYTYVCIYIYIYTYVFMYVYIYICIYVCINIYMFVTHVYMYMYICLCLCLCIWYMIYDIWYMIYVYVYGFICICICICIIVLHTQWSHIVHISFFVGWPANTRLVVDSSKTRRPWIHQKKTYSYMFKFIAMPFCEFCSNFQTIERPQRSDLFGVLKTQSQTLSHLGRYNVSESLSIIIISPSYPYDTTNCIHGPCVLFQWPVFMAKSLVQYTV